MISYARLSKIGQERFQEEDQIVAFSQYFNFNKLRNVISNMLKNTLRDQVTFKNEKKNLFALWWNFCENWLTTPLRIQNIVLSSLSKGGIH